MPMVRTKTGMVGASRIPVSLACEECWTRGSLTAFCRIAEVVWRSIAELESMKTICVSTPKPSCLPRDERDRAKCKEWSH